MDSLLIEVPPNLHGFDIIAMGDLLEDLRMDEEFFDLSDLDKEIGMEDELDYLIMIILVTFNTYFGISMDSIEYESRYLQYTPTDIIQGPKLSILFADINYVTGFDTRSMG